MMNVHESFLARFNEPEVTRAITLELPFADARRLFEDYRALATHASYTESIESPYSTLTFTFGHGTTVPPELEMILRGRKPFQPAVRAEPPTPRTAWEWILDPAL